MCSHKSPNDPAKIPDRPFESENAMAEEHARVLEAQRKSSGNLPDQPKGLEVRDDRPYKNLRSA